MARESYVQAAGARRWLGQVALNVADHGRLRAEAARVRGFSVLARAMRATRPGVVFADAAARGEIAPLTNPDSRLFVALPVQRAGPRKQWRASEPP